MKIQTIQRHWLLDVAKRARFIEGGVSQEGAEQFVRWRGPEGYWKQTMEKDYGEGLTRKKFGTLDEEREGETPGS